MRRATGGRKKAGFQLSTRTDTVPDGPRWQHNRMLIALALLVPASSLLSHFAPPWGDRLFVLTTLIGLFSVARSAWQRLRSGSQFTIETLMTLASAGALIIGAHAEAAMVLVLVLFQLGTEEWQPWIYKGLTLLLIGCPCALVISTPAAITSGLAAAARQGALIKGGAALDRLSSLRMMAFDKTGTLTVGKPQLIGIVRFGAASEAEILALSAAVEQGATHPLATAIVAAAEARNLTIPAARDQQVQAGRGQRAAITAQP